MKAIRIAAPVGIDGLVYEDAPDPTPAIGDVLVEVHACGFTASELYWPLYTDRAGRDRTPLIPGHEFSGVVVGLGYGTAGVAVGDEVYGLIDGYRDGAAAELIVIEARDVAPAPSTIDHVQAASLPQAALTSWQALFDHGRLAPGQTVMIHGAAGAVGSIAVQLAKAKGVRVIGTGRPTVRSLVLDLGADEFVDLEQDGWPDDVDDVDVVFDTIGGDVLERSVSIVRPGGAIVSVASPHPPTATTSGPCSSFAIRTARSWSRSPASSTPATSGHRSVRSIPSPRPARRSPPSRPVASPAGSSSSPDRRSHPGAVEIVPPSPTRPRA